MAEKPNPSSWQKINWNPVAPGLLLAWWLFRLHRGNWNWNWISILGTLVFSTWLAGAIYNWLSGGKFVEWMNSGDE